MALPTVIPSLTINQPFIKDRASKLAYLIKFALHNPGWTSSLIENQLVSMRNIEAKCGNDHAAVATMLQQQLSAAMHLHDDDADVSVTVGVNDQNEYRYVIKVVDVTSRELLLTNDIIKNVNGDLILSEME
jgi:hypothetical protein